jgi:hypothetical protein
MSLNKAALRILTHSIYGSGMTPEPEPKVIKPKRVRVKDKNGWVRADMRLPYPPRLMHYFPNFPIKVNGKEVEGRYFCNSNLKEPIWVEKTYRDDKKMFGADEVTHWKEEIIRKVKK